MPRRRIRRTAQTANVPPFAVLLDPHTIAADNVGFWKCQNAPVLADNDVGLHREAVVSLSNQFPVLAEVSLWLTADCYQSQKSEAILKNTAFMRFVEVDEEKFAK